jgi:hypothetical protein
MSAASVPDKAFGRPFTYDSLFMSGISVTKKDRKIA